VSNSSIRSEQQYVTHTYNKTTVPTGVAPDLRPMVLTGMVFTDGPRLSSRANITATTDFKATNRLVLSLTAMFNAFENNAHTKALTFNAAANGVAAATGRQNVLGDGLTDIRTNGLAANTSRTLTYGGGTAIKLTNSFTLTPKFEYKLGGLTVDGTANFSRSKNDYETSSRGSIRTETLNALTADFRATRPHANSAEWTIVQTGGADWSNLANFTNPRSMSLMRLIVSEVRRYPELMTASKPKGFPREILANWLSAPAVRAQYAIEDPDEASAMLFGMVMQDSGFRLMVDSNATMPPHQIETRARRAVQIFLRGVRTGG
jgi:hypothetical protein